MAEAGQLVCWAAGPVGKVPQSLFDATCRKVIWLGADPRLAAAAKLALNFLMNTNIVAFAEALAYASHHGVDAGRMAQGLTETAFAAPLFEAIAAGITGPDDRPKGGDVHLSAKDVDLFARADTSGSFHPLGERVGQVLQNAVAAGLGDLDPTAIRRLFLL